MTAPLAVLWDMDGTLIDSEPYWMAAETELIESYGGSWTTEQALELVGSGLFDSAAIIQRAGVPMSAQEIVDHLTAAVISRIESSGVPFRPGARELLFSLREAGIKTALVTMSLHRMAKSVVNLIDFPAFDLVIGGDDARRPKPYPDPYLQACEAFEIDPALAVAIEDSPTGLAAAIASGAVSLGVQNIISIENLGADDVWHTLEGRTADDIAELFGRRRPQEATA